MRYWLLKTEPHVFSLADLRDSPNQTANWEGVRNYQARNHLREMNTGDRAFIYHSSTKIPGIAGLAKIVTEAHPDPTQFDPESDYHDPKSPLENPRWSQVSVQFDREIPFVTLETLKSDPKLEGMTVTQRGSRLSVQPVSAAHWKHILNLAGVDA